jgi:hypothetical protein
MCAWCDAGGGRVMRQGRRDANGGVKLLCRCWERAATEPASDSVVRQTSS